MPRIGNVAGALAVTVTGVASGKHFTPAEN